MTHDEFEPLRPFDVVPPWFRRLLVCGLVGLLVIYPIW